MKRDLRFTRLALMTMVAIFTMTSCTDDDNGTELGPLVPEDVEFGKANDTFSAEEWFPGGELGTTTKASYSAPAPAVENIRGM